MLDMMINSVYTNREIFLRELISNASDAIDKLAYLSLTDPSVGLSREDFKITLTVDKAARTLTVSDNGIGMTAEELENNLGVIARSGSLEFKKEHAEELKEDTVGIIGQFGVGFYSAFMVASKVQVRSKKYGEEGASLWESSGGDGYTVKPASKDSVGTDVVLYIREDVEDESYGMFLESYELRRIVKKYSDYIRYPILTDVERTRRVEGSDSEKPEFEKYTETETLNSMIPLWRRNKSEVTDEEINEFYRDNYYDAEPPLKVIRIDAEGLVSFKAMLFIPASLPHGYYTKDFEKGLQLYSGGVMIIDRCGELLPEHFRFVKGVVESDDLSLNISRELLQQDKQLRVIAQNIEKRIKRELKKMLDEEKETYERFFKLFGIQLKYGLVSDFGIHKETLSDLLIYHTSRGGEQVTLEKYVETMPAEQKYIYYACGESLEKVESLPQTEKLRQKGFDIVYMTDEIDEFAVEMLGSVGDKSFKNVSRDDLELESEDEREQTKQSNELNRELLDFIKETLGVSAVRMSSRLVTHPVCLTSDGQITLEMEKYFAAMPGENHPKAERVLELNGDHRIFGLIKDAFLSDKELAAKYARLLYGQALLIAGFPLDDPAGYCELVCDLL